MNWKKAVVALGLSAGLACGARAAEQLAFVERGGENNYGWQSYDLAVGVTVLPWSIPNSESSVYGLRFNFGWGAYVDMYGLDSGLFSVTTRDFGGFSATIFGNLVEGEMDGVQIGVANIARGAAYGLQVGVVNFAEDLHGVQIGVLNFNRSGLACFPVLNAGF